MKIALFLNAFPSISETFIFNQLDALLAHGHEIVIFPRYHSGETAFHPVVKECNLLQKTHFPIQSGGTLLSRILFRLHLLYTQMVHRDKVDRLRERFPEYQSVSSWRRILVEAAPVIKHGSAFDILFAHFGPNGLRASLYRDAGLVSGPLVTVFHGYDLTEYVQHHTENVYLPLFTRGDLFLPISHFWERRLVDLACPSKRIRVFHVGIDCDHFSFRTRGIANDEPVILVSVARLVEKKGIEYAIRALALLIRTGIQIRYRVIGDGPRLGSLKQLVEESGLNDVVTFTGVKTSDEVAAELGRAHIFLAPSITSASGDMEGIPTVLMEAMAVGMPVISTLHSGIPELIENGVSGILVPERDPEALAAAIQNLIHDEALWQSMGEAGRQKVLGEFNIQKLGADLERHFCSLQSSQYPNVAGSVQET